MAPSAPTREAASGTDGRGFDLLAIEVFSWSPHLETSCEVCLCEANRGKKVGFAFLNVLNLDEYHQWGRLAPLAARLLKRYRLGKVKAIAQILREQGVSVFILDEKRSGNPRLTLQEASIHSVEDLRNYRIHDANLGLGVLSSLIFHCRNIDPDLVKYKRLTNLLLTSALRSYRLASDLLDRYQPADVLVFNGRFACAKGIVEATRHRDTRVLYHEVGATKDRYFLSDKTAHNSGNLRQMLWDDWCHAGPDREAIGAAFFAPGRKGLNLLEARHDNGQQRNESIPPTHRRRLVFFASSIDEFAAVEDGYDQHLFDTQREAVEWLVAWVRERPEMELIIRLHPRMRHLSKREREWWMSFSHDNVLTIPGEHPCNSYALVATSEKVINFHSSLGPEATYLGKASILVGDAKYRGLDCVYEPSTLAELEAMLNDQSLPAKPAQNCLPFGYSRVMAGTPYQYYQAKSYSDGSFFGKTYPPLPTRIEIRMRKWMGYVQGYLDRIRAKNSVAYWQ